MIAKWIAWIKLYIFYSDYAKIITEMVATYPCIDEYKYDLKICNSIDVPVVYLGFTCNDSTDICILFINGTITVSILNRCTLINSCRSFDIYSDTNDDSEYTECVSDIYISFIDPRINEY